MLEALYISYLLYPASEEVNIPPSGPQSVEKLLQFASLV